MQQSLGAGNLFEARPELVRGPQGQDDVLEAWLVGGLLGFCLGLKSISGDNSSLFEDQCSTRKTLLEPKLSERSSAGGLLSGVFFAIFWILSSPAEKNRESVSTSFCCHSKGREAVKTITKGRGSLSPISVIFEQSKLGSKNDFWSLTYFGQCSMKRNIDLVSWIDFQKI